MNRDALAPKIDATMQRKQVCAVEIFCECFGRPRNTWKKSDGYEIANIMARIQGWERTGKRARIEGYGQQRPYSRKLSQRQVHNGRLVTSANSRRSKTSEVVPEVVPGVVTS